MGAGLVYDDEQAKRYGNRSLITLTKMNRVAVAVSQNIRLQTAMERKLQNVTSSTSSAPYSDYMVQR
ncbi:hypothetical protein OS493_022610 [Desmophyllum pertusum]|uniref:Uncharacterized protein n=1 Tax=Desmophyllum pertusum TaxID=174260 RepID=A0A9W9Z297_9CNID|nr:hypothetical protein OS493_022610 [Desmophyllum pertusum]